MLATEKSSFCRVDAKAVFARPENSDELVFVDRLVRTLHTLNYLTYLDRKSRGLLLLRVHPRHVASVAGDHGLAFEEILRSCGLLPAEIILELEVYDGIDSEHLLRAIANYKSRGYGIALRGSDDRIPSQALIHDVRPMLVSFKLNGTGASGVISTATDSVPAPFAEALRDQGVKTLLRGEYPATFRKGLFARGIDLYNPPRETTLLRAS